MNRRTFLIMAVLLAVLGGAAFLRERARTRAARDPELRTGAPLLPGFEPAAVAALEVIRPGRTDRIERGETGWVVASAHGYPADLPRLVEVVRSLADLKVGAVIRGGESRLADFGMEAAEDGDPDRPATLRLLDEQGHERARLKVGSARMVDRGDRFGGRPDGTYVRIHDGPVILVGESMAGLPRQAEDWMPRAIAEIPERAVRSIAVTRDGEQIALTRDDEDGWRLADMDEASETMNRGKAYGLARALEYLRFHRLPAQDLPDETTGMDAPVVAAYRLAGGLHVEVRIGAESEDAETRYLRLSVAEEAGDALESGAAREGEAPRAAGEAEAHETAVEGPSLEALRRVDGWLYLVRSTSAEPFLVGRDDLVEPIAEDEEGGGDEAGEAAMTPAPGGARQPEAARRAEL